MPDQAFEYGRKDSSPMNTWFFKIRFHIPMVKKHRNLSAEGLHNKGEPTVPYEATLMQV